MDVVWVSSSIFAILSTVSYAVNIPQKRQPVAL